MNPTVENVTKNDSCCDRNTATTDVHPDHRKVLNRLKRSEGQVRGIMNMIEENRYCVDILVQTRALVASLKAVESEIMRTHLESCVKETLATKDPVLADVKLKELMSLIQRFD